MGGSPNPTLHIPADCISRWNRLSYQYVVEAQALYPSSIKLGDGGQSPVTEAGAVAGLTTLACAQRSAILALRKSPPST